MEVSACETCYGAVDVDNKTYSTITRNSHYYVMAHMGSVVKPVLYALELQGIPRKDLLMQRSKIQMEPMLLLQQTIRQKV